MPDKIGMTTEELRAIKGEKAQWRAVGIELTGVTISSPEDLLSRYRWSCGVSNIMANTAPAEEFVMEVCRAAKALSDQATREAAPLSAELSWLNLALKAADDRGLFDYRKD